jgi:hypothetical protein
MLPSAIHRRYCSITNRISKTPNSQRKVITA